MDSVTLTFNPRHKYIQMNILQVANNNPTKFDSNWCRGCQVMVKKLIRFLTNDTCDLDL